MAFRRSGVQIPSGPLSPFAVSTCDSQGFAKRLTDEGFTIKLSDIFISLRFNSNPCCCAIRANIDCTLIKKTPYLLAIFLLVTIRLVPNHYVTTLCTMEVLPDLKSAPSSLMVNSQQLENEPFPFQCLGTGPHLG